MLNTLSGALGSIRDKAGSMLSSTKESVTNSGGQVDQATLDSAKKYGTGTQDPNHGKPLEEVVETDPKKKKKKKKEKELTSTEKVEKIGGALSQIGEGLDTMQGQGAPMKAAPAARGKVSTVAPSSVGMQGSAYTDFNKYRL